ncbi:hypothetical protein FPV67DRAFT_1400445, partial [Lyophyllum atratum]
GQGNLINMIADGDLATVSDNGKVCTLNATPYRVAIKGDAGVEHFVIYDTAGYNEDKNGSVEDLEAISNPFRLLKSLDAGVSLLVFCMRGPRINDTVHKSWLLFHKVICDSQVPIILTVTGLEHWQKGDMNNWYTENRKAFDKY